MNECRYVAEMAVRIVLHYWPDMKIMGATKDRRGIDAIYNFENIQIKGDKTIDATKNLYHEYYEKTKGRPDQPWRRSPAPVHRFIFVTSGLLVSIPIQVMAKLEIGLRITAISDTSIGALIPLRTVPKNYCFHHDLWIPFEMSEFHAQKMEVCTHDPNS